MFTSIGIGISERTLNINEIYFLEKSRHMDIFILIVNFNNGRCKELCYDKYEDMDSDFQKIKGLMVKE